MTNIVQSQANPYFYATLSAPVPNVTGAGVDYTCIWDTLVSGSGYNPATGYFTCSVPGDYLFTAIVHISNLAITFSSGSAIFVVNSTDSYYGSACKPGNMRNNSSVMIYPPLILPLKMEAGDNVRLDIKISNGTNVVTFNTLSTFSGVRLP